MLPLHGGVVCLQHGVVQRDLFAARASRSRTGRGRPSSCHGSGLGLGLQRALSEKGFELGAAGALPLAVLVGVGPLVVLASDIPLAVASLVGVGPLVVRKSLLAAPRRHLVRVLRVLRHTSLLRCVCVPLFGDVGHLFLARAHEVLRARDAQLPSQPHAHLLRLQGCLELFQLLQTFHVVNSRLDLAHAERAEPAHRGLLRHLTTRCLTVPHCVRSHYPLLAHSHSYFAFAASLLRLRGLDLLALRLHQQRVGRGVGLQLLQPVRQQHQVLSQCVEGVLSLFTTRDRERTHLRLSFTSQSHSDSPPRSARPSPAAVA